MMKIIGEKLLLQLLLGRTELNIMKHDVCRKKPFKSTSFLIADNKKVKPFASEPPLNEFLYSIEIFKYTRI